MRLGNVEMLLLFWLLPAIAGLYAWAAYKRKQALRAFIDSGLLDRVPISSNPHGRVWKAVLFILAISSIIVALSRPAWNPKPQIVKRKGRDIVFVLDVSRSMLATDLKPSRLERAKIAIKDMIERLQGDRVALVVFAGTAVVKCPLTLDYGFFNMMLDDVSVESVSRGGTLIGDAIRKALDEAFDDQVKKYKDIILITDGEDHDSFPVDAAREAAKRGVRIIAIGLGDENQGSRIPIVDETGRKTFLKYKGREVWSKLDASTLRKMVNATPGGKYLNVATGTIDLGDVYTRLIASEEKREIESRSIKLYEEKFQIFVALAILFLAMELVVAERRNGRKR